MTDFDALDQVDPFYMALLRARQRRFADCIDVCSDILAQNPYDQAAWVTKTKAMTMQNFIDDSELEEDGAADLLMDDNVMASMPRPGTSLNRPNSRAGTGDPSLRPMTSTGRPLSGFARPGTSSRPGTGSMSVDRALQGNRPGTSRPATTLGRQVRLGTASMKASDSGVFIDVNRLDFKRYAKRPAIAKALVDYLLYCEHNPRKALELAAEATVAADYKDWWWKARLGKCYYQLGLFRDAEKQFESSLRNQDMVITFLELGKVYLRLDQPNTALDRYEKGKTKFPGDVQLLVSIARVHDMLNDVEKSVSVYKEVLQLDASNVEAIACLASNYFYTDHPEVALRYYRRLLQMDVNTAELWCNIGLCCFYASQYDMTLSCFDRALSLASDDCMADVWYNIGQVAIGIGDLGLAYQAFKIAVSVDSNHAESYNNLGVLELRKGNLDQARANFQLSESLADFMFEPSYNRGESCVNLKILARVGANFVPLVCCVASAARVQGGRLSRLVHQGQPRAHDKSNAQRLVGAQEAAAAVPHYALSCPKQDIRVAQDAEKHTTTSATSQRNSQLNRAYMKNTVMLHLVNKSLNEKQRNTTPNERHRPLLSLHLPSGRAPTCSLPWLLLFLFFLSIGVSVEFRGRPTGVPPPYPSCRC
ncbi:unnamed protein product [Phytophthora lilii]|uniref:Unnamed protein product n=1 Tax=Phytophthora lilii TaxID=2077276 RepID=A0A9W6YD30_9STRA|nr:unnamed protein product [Phytophthora lilii]